jgi:hypothetical protein
VVLNSRFLARPGNTLARRPARWQFCEPPIISRLVCITVPAPQGAQYCRDVFPTAAQEGHQAEHQRRCGHEEDDGGVHRLLPQLSGVASRIVTGRC